MAAIKNKATTAAAVTATATAAISSISLCFCLLGLLLRENKLQLAAVPATPELFSRQTVIAGKEKASSLQGHHDSCTTSIRDSQERLQQQHQNQYLNR